MKRTNLSLRSNGGRIGGVLLGLSAFAASAHEGHGLPGPSHWHATDVFGVVLIVALGAALLWWRNRK